MEIYWMASLSLDMVEIQHTLENVQQQYYSIITMLDARIAPMDDLVIDNLLAGYELIDQFVNEGIDLFSLGYSTHILEINNTVLFGPANGKDRQHYTQQLKASEKYFYEKSSGGIQDLIEYHQQTHFSDAFTEAAAVYIRTLAQPQLFVEGNHRTGVLLMSYILLRNGFPPFVLSADNAKHYFEAPPISKIKRHSLTMLIKRSQLNRFIASLLKKEASKAHHYFLDKSKATHITDKKGRFYG